MAIKNFTFTKDYLHQIFEYSNGELYWKVASGRRSKVGTKAGFKADEDGRLKVGINNSYWFIHRIIFFMFHNEQPNEIDHIDGNPKNNRIENLRAVTHHQNMMNSKTPSHNTSGVKGVYFNKKKKKWVAQCFVDGKNTYVGTFNDINVAKIAIVDFRNKVRKEFANHL